MADKRVVFVAFAIEDERQRGLLRGQILNTTSPFEYPTTLLARDDPKKTDRRTAMGDTKNVSVVFMLASSVVDDMSRGANVEMGVTDGDVNADLDAAVV